MAAPPLPPEPLMRRVGVSGDDVALDYLRIGRFERDVVVTRLPAGWGLAGRRILDFGCGAGSALRHFSPEIARGAEFWGCDIDERSIDWVSRNLPGVNAFHNNEAPPLEVPDAHFDLVYAVSVFTHITDHWADWLIELHRVLRPGGILIASVLGQSMYEQLCDAPYEDESVGMTVAGIGIPWDAGGPLVFHSRWWIERHWAPAFEIVRYESEVRSEDGDFGGHDLVIGRRAATDPDRHAMVVPCEDEPREATAALANVRLLSVELERLRNELSPSST